MGDGRSKPQRQGRWGRRGFGLCLVAIGLALPALAETTNPAPTSKPSAETPSTTPNDIAPATPPPALSPPLQAVRVPPPLTSPLSSGWLPRTLLAVPPSRQPTPYRINLVATVRQDVVNDLDRRPITRTTDLITTFGVTFDVTSRTRRAQLSTNGSISYQRILTNSDSFGAAPISLASVGEVTLIERFLTVDAHTTISDVLINSINAPVTPRAVIGNQARVSAYDAGPLVTTKIADLFDVTARARRAVVDFQTLNGSVLPFGLVKASIDQVGGSVSTGEHLRLYQVNLAGEHVQQGEGFRLYNAVGSLIWGSQRTLQLVGRFGYENISDPGITDLEGPIWSAGFITRPGRASYVRVEYGHRYGKPAWNATGTYAITPKLAASGAYTRTLESEQSRIHRTFTGLTSQTGDPPSPYPAVLDPILLPLVSGTFLTDDAGVSLVWQIDPSTELRENVRSPYQHRGTVLAVSASSALRKSLTLGTEARRESLVARATHDLNRFMAVTLDLGVGELFETRPLEQKSRDYRAELGVTYGLTRAVAISGSVIWQRSVPALGSPNSDFALSMVLAKRFY